MIKLYNTKNECCGCTACMNICKSGAISMTRDEKGFIYPVIESEKCIDCKLCEQVCQYKSVDINKHTQGDVYALQHKDGGVLKMSSSGGAYTAVSDILLDDDYIIFACVLDENMDVYHRVVYNKAEREKTRGSKYVQSDLKNTYSEIKELLSNNNKVCFVGTPCQVSGLYFFLNKTYENLFSIDFLCHGPLSLRFLHDHVNYLSEIYKKKITGYNFRDKKFGWIHTETAVFEGGKKNYSRTTQCLKSLFYSNKFLIPACYSCRYTDVRRVSDITIGDFWGVEKPHKIYDNKGVSLLILNSEQAKKMLPDLNVSCKIIESKMEYAMQRVMQKPAPKPKDTDEAWKLYFDSGYETIVKKFCKSTPKQYFSFYYRRFTHMLKLDKYRIILNTKIRK